MLGLFFLFFSNNLFLSQIQFVVSVSRFTLFAKFTRANIFRQHAASIYGFVRFISYISYVCQKKN